MSKAPDHTVVLFADVSGSTQMYERLGDATAHQFISLSLQRIIHHATRFQGRLVETIGDEAFILFESPADAARSACAIQQHFAREPIQDRYFVKVRIGFHYGPLEFDPDGHPFGDTINVAARVVALCETGRIIATRDSLVDCRDLEEFDLRPYQRARVKGKAVPLILEEIVWESEDATSLFNLTQTLATKPAGKSMTVSYMGNRVTLSTDRPNFVIGRGTDCDLIVESALASRRHCHLEFRWGEVYLVDHSTNGTYLSRFDDSMEGGGSARLHRREVALSGRGCLSIGTPVEASEPVCLIEYQLY